MNVETPLLCLQGLAIATGNVRLLDGVDLEIAPGELIAVTGPSGCGKTSLLRAICGLDALVAGAVLLQGQPAEAWGWPHFRRKVILVHQRPVLLDASVVANLQRPFTYQTSDRAFPVERARELLER